MKNYKLYAVGGCIRDGFLGIKSKDIDYSFEFTKEFIEKFKDEPALGFYEVMNSILKEDGFEIFLETPEAFTTRARFPDGHEHEGLTCDFVLCRKETYPNPNSRMPVVGIGSLYDDLERRDATCNAIAQDEYGNLIDPFNGIWDIKAKVLRCPVSPQESFNSDPLRMMRFLRFSITKGFRLASEVEDVILNDEKMWEKFSVVVSEERIREELFKMMKHDSIATMKLLVDLDSKSGIDILEKILGDSMWLKPTTEKRK